MKITLDHNCIIDLVRCSRNGGIISNILAQQTNQCFVVNIGASEMRKYGVRPDRYDKFEDLLSTAGVSHLPRLNPMAFWDVTFWNRCVWPDKKSEGLANDIQSVLFPHDLIFDSAGNNPNSLIYRKWINRMCDVLSMWCHIINGNEVFLTSDRNFMKPTKKPRLIGLGAGKICRPDQL